METREEKIKRLLSEKIELVKYRNEWPTLFDKEKKELFETLPGLINRIEHMGSTAVKGMVAKPIIDMLVEVTSVESARKTAPKILEPKGYDYIFRPTFGDDTGPFYPWFIKRDSEGIRTHHIHMVEKDFPHWDRILFRNYLSDHPNVAKKYGELKEEVHTKHKNNRVLYTQAKTDFIEKYTDRAIAFYKD